MRRFIPILTLTALVACSGPDGTDKSPTGSDPDGTTDGSDPTNDPTGDPTEDACQTWLVTYDLTGSRFFIDSLVDFTITVQEPYDEDLNTGPGRIVLRLPDGGGQPTQGPSALVEYQLMWDFVTGAAGLASVHTEIANAAGPDPAGVATGTLAGGTLSWASPGIEVCQEGQISCTGAFCGTSGSPPEDEPEIIEGCEPWTLNDFVFSQDLQTFDMDASVVSEDSDTTTAMAFHGTFVDMEADAGGCR